jgi:hypothetical protein
MRRRFLGIIAALFLCVLAGGNRADAQQILPAPTGLTIAEDVPQAPDSFSHSASLSWKAVTFSEPFEYIVEVSVPPRTGGSADFAELARVAASAAPRQIISTLAWRGPYCFRVRVAANSTLGEPSAPVCVPKTSEAAPFDVRNLRVEFAPSFLYAELSWDYGAFPAPLTIQRSVTGSFDSPRSWQTITEEAPAREHETGVDFRDGPLGAPGNWYCYRAKVTDDAPDVIWSEEACAARPVVDGPRAPDVGNSPVEPLRGFELGLELKFAGAFLLLAGLVHWLRVRGWR